MGVRLIDYGQDRKVAWRELYRLPREFATEGQHGGPFSFFIHLAQIPRDFKTDGSVVQTMREVLSGVSSTYYIPLSLMPDSGADWPDYSDRYQPERLGDYWSIPAELCWMERRTEDPFGPAVERAMFLSQILFNRGLVQVELLEPETLSVEVSEEDAASNIIEEEENVEADYEIEEEDFWWEEAALPTQRKFKARGTHVDVSGQIYIHLYKERKLFNDLKSRLRRLQSERELDEFFEEQEERTLISLKENQAVIAPHTDGCLHRASFLKFLPNSDRGAAVVHYVDWGSVGVVDTKELRKEVLLMDRPIFAFRVVLGDVLPSDGNDWSLEAIDFIYEKVLYLNRKQDTKTNTYHNSLKIKLLSPEQTEEPLLASIQLFTPDVENKDNPYYSPWVDLSTVLVQRGLAVAATPEQVNSLEQRQRRQRFTFGRQAERLREEEERRIFPPPQRDQEFQHLPLMESNLRLEGGDVVDCKVVSRLAWNVVTVHLVNEETDSVNRTVYNLLEGDGPACPIVEAPR